MPLITTSIPGVVDTTTHFESFDGITGVQLADSFNEKSLSNSVLIEKEVDARDWRSMIRRGENATTHMVVTRDSVDYSPGSGSSEVRSFVVEEITDPDTGTHVANIRGGLSSSVRYRYYGGIVNVGGNIAPFADLEAADNRALISFYNHCRSAQTLEQGGTFLGEIGQTIHGIRHPAESIVKFLSSHMRSLSKKRTAIRSAMAHGNYDRVKQLAHVKHIHSVDQAIGSMVSNSWLEAQFHWLPLVSDVVDSARAVANVASRKGSKPVRGGGSDETMADEITITDTTWQPFVLHYVRGQKHRIDIRYYGSVSLSIPGSGFDFFQSYAQALGLNLSNFIPTIYNVIPFSFVADYFSNLGDVIDALSFPKSDVGWASRVVLEEVIDYVSSPSLERPEYDLFTELSGSLNPGKLKVAYQTITRNPISLDLLSLPSVELKVPGLSSRKWLNLSALASQLAIYRRS